MLIENKVHNHVIFPGNFPNYPVSSLGNFLQFKYLVLLGAYACPFCSVMFIRPASIVNEEGNEWNNLIHLMKFERRCFDKNHQRVYIHCTRIHHHSSVKSASHLPILYRFGTLVKSVKFLTTTLLRQMYETAIQFFIYFNWANFNATSHSY